MNKGTNNIGAILSLIRYFKSKEVVPSKNEEDKIWNDIVCEIENSRRKHRFIKMRNISIASLSAAAMRAGALWFLHFDRYENNNDLMVAYQSMNDYATESKEIKILAEDKQMAEVKNNATIDYSKSDSQVEVDDKKIEKAEKVQYHQLVVPKGKHTRLILADGSVMHVNAATKVVYPDRFEDDRREIFVDGEIFIDVAKNEKVPFVVRTNSCDIQVLGTAFNVQAYKTDANTEVALVRGSIKLKDKENKELLLKPNELATVSENRIQGKKKVDASDYITWTKGLLKLDATPLSSVFKRLERYYGVQIAYSEEVGNMKMYGNLDLECPAEEVLRRLEYTAPISFEKNNDKFSVRKR